MEEQHTQREEAAEQQLHTEVRLTTVSDVFIDAEPPTPKEEYAPRRKDIQKHIDELDRQAEDLQMHPEADEVCEELVSLEEFITRARGQIENTDFETKHAMLQALQMVTYCEWEK